MPIYEYKCGDCGAKFEQLTSHAKADSVACRECGSDQTQRLLSVFGVTSAAGSASSPCADGACPAMAGVPSCGPGACPSCHLN